MINSKLTNKQAEMFWKLAYNLNAGIKKYMDYKKKKKNGVITDKEINDLENYKINGWNNIVNTITKN